jgi:hypothetical protein
MPSIKIATFNLEWLVLAFGGEWTDWVPPTIPPSFPGGKVGGVNHEPIPDVHGMCRRVAGVIGEIDAKIVAYQEGPPLKAQMEAFVDRFLGGEYVVHHSNPRWQSVGALVHASIADQVAAWQPMLPPVPAAWTKIPFYPWGLIAADEQKQHKLDRHPLLLSVAPEPGKELRVVVVHTKSKFSKLKRKEQWEQRDREAVLDALTARAKLSAEVFRIREFLTRQLAAAGESRSIAVMGDLNDGPYAELMEREFLIHNIVDELAGSLLAPGSYFKHAMTPETLQTAATTRFPDPLEGGRIVEELIDHVLVSPAIWMGDGDFRIEQDSCRVEAGAYEHFYDDDPNDRQRGLRPSDHKPVSVVFAY